MPQQTLPTAASTFSSLRLKKRPLLAISIAERIPGGSNEGGPLTQRWFRCAGTACWQLVSHHKGRIVRDLGTALLLEFVDARPCIQAAFALNQLTDSLNVRTDESRQLHLRTLAHLAPPPCEQKSPDGRDMPWSSEPIAWAGPGEVWVTAELRDQLVNGLDADFEDLGYRTGPLAQTVRLFRAHPRNEGVPKRRASVGADPRPGLAVMPFRAGTPEAMHGVIGELIADGVIARLSHSVGLRMIARQSTSALRQGAGLDEIGRHLGTNFVLSGSYSLRDNQLMVTAELAEVRRRTRLWAGQLRHPLRDLFHEASALLHELACTVARALNGTQVKDAMTRPLPSLDSGFLMLAGISMTHSHSDERFERGRDAWAALSERYPQHALPRAWLAMWHALSLAKGRSAKLSQAIQRARAQTQRALQVEPGNAMALAVEGYIHGQLLGDPQQAGQRLTAAIEANPSEPMAWLFKSLHSACWGSSSLSVTEANVARNLSPIDPLQYFFDLLMGTAFMADQQLKQAIAWGHRSLRANRHHVPTLRLLLTAHTELGQIRKGRAVLNQLRAEAPNMTVSSYLAMGSAESPLRQRVASALRQLGLPQA